MKIRYKVHGLQMTEFTVDAIVAGKETQAVIPGLIVEAVSEDGSMGHSFKYWGDHLKDVIDRASPGDELEVSIKWIDKDGKGVLLASAEPEAKKK